MGIGCRSLWKQTWLCLLTLSPSASPPGRVTESSLFKDGIEGLFRFITDTGFVCRNSVRGSGDVKLVFVWLFMHPRHFSLSSNAFSNKPGIRIEYDSDEFMILEIPQDAFTTYDAFDRAANRRESYRDLQCSPIGSALAAARSIQRTSTLSSQWALSC